VKLEQVREIYLIREVLEALAVRLAVPQLDSTHIECLRELQQEIEADIANRHLGKLRELNCRFHMLIYEAAGMPELYRIIRNLWTKFPWDTLHVLPGRASESAEEHRLLIQAIEDRNAELADQLIQQHIEHGVMALAKYLSDTQQAEAVGAEAA
jgi:DNA-binding GntR family transcriptional regulator